MPYRADDQRFLEVDVGLKHAHHLVVDDVGFAHLHELLAFCLDRVRPDVALRVVQCVQVLPPVGVGGDREQQSERDLDNAHERMVA